MDPLEKYIGAEVSLKDSFDRPRDEVGVVSGISPTNPTVLVVTWKGRGDIKGLPEFGVHRDHRVAELRIVGSHALAPWPHRVHDPDDADGFRWAPPHYARGVLGYHFATTPLVPYDAWRTVLELIAGLCEGIVVRDVAGARGEGVVITADPTDNTAQVLFFSSSIGRGIIPMWMRQKGLVYARTAEMVHVPIPWQSSHNALLDTTARPGGLSCGHRVVWPHGRMATVMGATSHGPLLLIDGQRVGTTLVPGTVVYVVGATVVRFSATHLDPESGGGVLEGNPKRTGTLQLDVNREHVRPECPSQQVVCFGINPDGRFHVHTS